MTKKLIQIVFYSCFLSMVIILYFVEGFGAALVVFISLGIFIEKIEKWFINQVQRHILGYRLRNGAGIELRAIQEEISAQLKINNNHAAFLLAEKAIKIAEEKAGNNHLDTASALMSMALVNRQMNKFGAAEENVRKALRIAEGSLGADHPELDRYLIALSATYVLQKQYSASLAVLNRLIAISFCERGPTLIRAYNRVADNYWRSGNHQEAEKWYKNAIQIIDQQPNPKIKIVVEEMETSLSRLEKIRKQQQERQI